MVRQKPIGDIKIDLWFRERGGGRVVCETERKTGGYETGSQIRRYLEIVAEQDLREGRSRPLRGVVITGAPNPAQQAEIAEWSLLSGIPVDGFYYRLSFDLEPATLTPS